MKRPRPALLPVLALALAGCDSYHFYRGRFYDETKRWAKATEALEAFIRRSPGDPRACEAHLRAGRIYSSVFDRNLEARRHYEAAARGFPQLTGCAQKARIGLMSSPDYFPLEAGRFWTYGDSASGGRNMRLDWELRSSTDGFKTFVLASLYAGNKRLSVKETVYVKRDWAVWEEGAQGFPVLKYPYSPGTAWSVRRGGYRVDYVIESDRAEAATRAGVFRDCLKVRETDARFPGSWKYDYYCPGVGRAKTTVGSRGAENPNTELIKFSR